MLNCREVTSAYSHEELERARWAQRLSIRFHLLMCRHCARYAGQLRAIGRAVRDLFAISPDESQRLRDLEARILTNAFGKHGKHDSPPGGR